MSSERILTVETLSSVYSKKKIKNRRSLDIQYSIPTNGVNEHTGFCMYISGFRGHANTNIAKKWEENFQIDII